ncbi:MAG: hypothetical protein OXR73_19105 [Myxococcales bacterium]|nr:hypothetical protein [Myxococcales bacterium]
MTMPKAYLSIGAFTLMVASQLPGTVEATALRYTELGDIIEHSDAVVKGTVLTSDVRVAPDGVPWTTHTLQVEEALAGAVEGPRVRVRCIGGRSGDRTLEMAGAPRVVPGDTIVAVLKEKGLCQFGGLERGVFWECRDSRGQARLVDAAGRAIASLAGRRALRSDQTVRRAAPTNLP